MPGVLPSVRQGGSDAVVPGIFADILSRSGEASGCGRTRMVIAGALKNPSELWGPGPLGMTHCLQPASMLQILVVQEFHDTFTLETLHGASELPEVLSRPDGNSVPVKPNTIGLQPITTRSINTEDFASGAFAILRCNCERNMFN
ncbi:hypothetical protein NEUTE1DRAFT_126550 [Neurospora tetrasperma FGSC 2508]|uniref:Uncharacterized protein n=1 Tax=Neurospora tetrasperma (strain FGSC 2508 / ATCC MYA-4615 / P0657) TaxID=510951 RepID=F8N1P5_NEUT8|nr:uncharacterized protein NEUTE1DRAFT_126550 [Neurospora tetrasperma FGSC 2508]EGO53171.1 hypothetical protein NEUTE1DRAFT_126550 [Neurospora tetrasperma FGSC 2508]